jgi:hypothetical protein
MLTTGTVVSRDRRTGRVVMVDAKRRKALVIWSGTWTPGWSLLKALRVVG